MLVSIFFIFSLYICFFSLGIFFQKYLIRYNLYVQQGLFEIIFFGIFFLSFLTLFFNFFIKLHNIFFIGFLILIILYSILNFKDLIKKNIKTLLLYSIILSPLCTFLEFGYDAGLYHIPFQTILQNDHINFGIANLHHRYATTTSYSYVAALLTHNNFFNIAASFSTVLFSLFFLFILERIKSKKFIDNVFAISAIITFPLWYRYGQISISIVDIFFSFFYFFTFYYGAQILFYKQNNVLELKERFFLFFIFLSYTISTKPTGVILALFLALIFFVKYDFFIKNLKDIILNNLISIFFIIFWALRNLVISSCLIYPVKITCFEFSWKTTNLNVFVDLVKNWNSTFFNSFFDILINYQLLIIFVLLLIILFLFFLKDIFNFLLNFRSLFLKLSPIIFLIVLFYTKPLKLTTWLIQSNQIEALKLTYLTEIILIFLYYILGFVFVILSFKKPILINNKIIDFKFSRLIPLIFFSFSLAIWFVFGKNPRLGQYLCLTLIPTLAMTFINQSTKILPFHKNYFKILILIIFFKISIIDNFNKLNNGSLIFLKQETPETTVFKRKKFGFSPGNRENFCWREISCYPYYDVEIFKNYFGYKFFRGGDN